MSDATKSESADVKRCWRCELTLPVSAFGSDRTKPSGLRTVCRECDRDKSRRYYAANRAKRAAYYLANRDAILERRARREAEAGRRSAE